MISINKKIQKLISIFLILAVLSPVAIAFSLPKRAEATGLPVIDIPQTLEIIRQNIKDYLKEIIKQFLMAVARKLIDKMTQSTINWINSGFKGKPLFVENQKSFFNDIKKDELKNLINVVAYDHARFPFGKDYALGLINQTKDTFESDTQYTLSKYTNDTAFLDSCQNDFNACGWDGLLMNTIFPQNNSLGYQMMANEELVNRLTGPDSKVATIQGDIQKGMGFMSPQVCKSNPSWDDSKLSGGLPKNEEPKYNPPNPSAYTDPDAFEQANSAYNEQYSQLTQKARADFQKKYSCPEGPAATTPGSVVASSIMNALGSKQRQGELGAALGNSLSAVFDALINKLMSAGLSKLTNTINSIPDPKIGDFNYYGPTTGGTLGNQPNPISTLLTISVEIINDNGGTFGDPSNLQPYVDGIATNIYTPKSYSPGLHTVSMDDLTHYSQIIGGDCARDGTVTLGTAGDKTCKITLDDIPKGSSAKMTVNVVVVNTHGGTVKADDISLFVDNNPKASGVEYGYDLGEHIVSESRPSGYSRVISGDCGPDGLIQISLLGSPKICTITNYDIPNFNTSTSTTLPKLTVGLYVINDNNGTLDVNSVSPKVDGSVVQNFLESSYSVGTHRAHVDNISGYTTLIGGDCALDGSIVLALGDTKFCKITLDDN